ncbi:MAG: GAF domain-containing protein, partial [Firmicutes bacterium]|nr:GAF domain-containing protein [Bacillota bacterium]
GAQRGFLLAVRDDDITVIAGRDQGLPPDGERGASPRGFSQAIVRYALRTNKPVLVPDAREDLLFAKDSYVRSFHPKSVLCLPLAWNDQQGVLYLENNLAANAFAADLIEPVERFASQALMVYQASLGPAANKIAAVREANVVFTNREAKILSLIAAGLSNIEIAARLHIAEGTVKWYTHRLFNKLGVESRTQAVVRAGELGLLALE